MLAAAQVYRAAYLAYHEACTVRDFDAMAAPLDQIRAVTGYLRSQGRTDLIFPLTMEWATKGGDAGEHARYREQVDKLLAV